MKTILDIENMKKQNTIIFDNAYNYLIEMLADYYISKNDGEIRIKNELDNWDLVAQKVILLDLKNCVEKSDIKFNLKLNENFN